MTDSDARPFAGLEVVEFGQFIAVPFCAQLLAEGGAHVVKVESLEGDPVRNLAPLAPGETRHFISRNRGKHSLPLDLRHAGAGAVITRLLARADVVLTNFRPGFAEELGLDYAALAPRHPRLIVGNVSAFGRRGPDAKLAGMDMVVQARSGLMSTLGRFNEEGVPTAGDAPVADYMCALILSFGIAAALLRRERTGRGGEVDVALLMAAMLLQNNSFVRVQSADAAVHAATLARLAELRAAGRPYAEQAAAMPTTRTPGMAGVYYRTYATRDAAVAVACVSPGLQRTFIKAIGLEDSAHARPIRDRDALARHYADLGRRAEAALAARTTAEWKAIFDAQGVPAAGVAFAIELLDDPQPLANGLFHDLAHPALGPVRVLAPPLQMDRDGFRAAPATPALGSETEAILDWLGFGAEEVERLVADGVTQCAKRAGNLGKNMAP
ncbi:MAG TPA: CoA transferase [Methylomirabilota bacterium]|nr:CoA transferase [Methylomirabilota bacterium]